MKYEAMKIFNVKQEVLNVKQDTWFIIFLPDLDVGQVWGWGYGGDGQLGLGNRVKTVASPHLIPCIDPSSCIKDKPDVVHQESESAAAQSHNSVGNYIRAVACGGRHSAVITGESWRIVMW